MDPITIGAAVMGGTAIIGGILNSLNAKKEKAATDAERKRIQDLIDKVQSPNFDHTKLDAPTFKVLQQYAPEVTDYIQEKAPQYIMANSEDAKAGRDAQRAALQRLRGLGETGRDAQSDALQEDAMRRQAIENNSQQASIRQNMQQRGIGGGGLELAQAMGAQQNAAQLGADASRSAMLEAHRTRLQALRDGASLGGQIRNEDVELESKNVGINNDFNNRLATNQNAYNRYKDGVHNDAQWKNIGQNQTAADKNVAGQFETAKWNINNTNDLEQRKYTNELNKVGLSAGVSNQRVADGQAAAGRTDSMISGVANVGMAAGMMYGNQKPAKAPAAPAYEDDGDQPWLGSNPLKRKYGG